MIFGVDDRGVVLELGVDKELEGFRWVLDDSCCINYEFRFREYSFLFIDEVGIGDFGVIFGGVGCLGFYCGFR